MSKALVNVFLCTGKDCARRWRGICSGSAGKWLKHQCEDAELPYELRVIKTECMDRCEDAACLYLVHGRHASLVTDVRSAHDTDRFLAAWRVCVESADVPLRSGP